MTCDRPAERSFWQRTLVGWHAAFYLVLALVAVVGGFDDEVSALRDRLALWALLALLGAWYTLFGRRLLGTGDNLRGVVYAVIAVALLTPALQITGASLLLMFVLFPQFFAVADLRYAIPLVAAPAVVVVLTAFTTDGWAADDPWAAAMTVALNTVFAVIFGLWIQGIIAESNRRAELVAELWATRAELAEAHHQAGVLAERERLSHEIHDTLAQGFTSILMLAQAAGTAVDHNPAAARERIEMIEDTARENLAEARSLIVALSPVDLASTSLSEALGRLVQRFGTELDLDVAVNVAGQVRSLPANVEVVLLRATQEALANVRKHAKATHVEVALTYDETSARLRVTDDGHGFQPADVDGFGLRGMRARVEQAGGQVEIRSSPGEGTSVEVVAAATPSSVS
jgi:signal transduction histidine kinase